MGRLEHLKQTLPQNIADNANDPNCQFVVVNYGGEKDTEQWIKESFQEQINTGKLKYVSYPTAQIYHSSHAKNIAHLMADGDIVCNLDADQYTGHGFTEFIARHFQQAESSKKQIFMRHNTLGFNPGNDDQFQSSGKIALKKSDFLKLRGYDETITGWGMDDTDLVLRMKFFARMRQENIPLDFISGVPHDDYLRVENFTEKDRARSNKKLATLRGERDPSTSTYCQRVTGKLIRGIPLIVKPYLRTLNSTGYGKGQVYVNFSETASDAYEAYAAQSPQTGCSREIGFE